MTLKLESGANDWRTTQAALLAPALRNLLENAILASPPGAAVDARLQHDGERICFSVLDRGPGIAKADRPHVTQRFYRGQPQPFRRRERTWLGDRIGGGTSHGRRTSSLTRQGGGEQVDLVLAVA